MSWVQTFVGHAVDLLDPKPETIDIHDIAHGLAYQCRFHGHTRVFYSVAQHSVACSRRVQGFGPATAYYALLHDAHETYIGDMPAPVKHLPEVRAVWMPIEKRLDEAIFKALGVPVDNNILARTKEADRWALAVEKRGLLGVEPQPWDGLAELESWETGVLHCWSPAEAEEAFLRRYRQLREDIERTR